MKIKYGKNNMYGEPVARETAWKVLIGIVVLSAIVIVAAHFGILI